MFYSCFPSFNPQEKMYKTINVDSGQFTLIHVLGTLDQEFPSSVYLKHNNDSVLLCKGYGIKDISLKDSTLVVKMNGQKIFFRNKIKTYKIKIVSEQGT